MIMMPNGGPESDTQIAPDRDPVQVTISASEPQIVYIEPRPEPLQPYVTVLTVEDAPTPELGDRRKAIVLALLNLAIRRINRSAQSRRVD